MSRPFGLLARLKQPLEFRAVDGEPVDLVFMLLLPAAFRPDQLNALAAVARRLRAEKLVELREASVRHDDEFIERMKASGQTKFRTRDASRILRCSRQIGELEPHQGWSPDTRELEEVA